MFLEALLCVLWVLPLAGVDARAGSRHRVPAELADSLRSASALCVHLGCGDGALTAELAKSGQCLVHGLTASRTGLGRARRHIERSGLYGQASVDLARLSRLPYADGMVNLAVADDLPRMLAAGLSLSEVARILCPGGTAWLGNVPAKEPPSRTEAELRRQLAAAGVGESHIVRRGGLWLRFRKPRPAGMDEWTHRTYDAAGNCVSRDTAVGPLATLRWISGPCWPMGTGYQVSNGGLVSAGGRVFSVTLNEVSNCARIPQDRNNEWFLTARDAYNGLLLWSRPIRRKMLRDGQEFGNYLVAAPDCVYALLGDHIVGLDPATGRGLRTYRKGVALGGKLLILDGTLVLAQGKSLAAMEAATSAVRWTCPASVQDLLAAEGKVLYTTRGHGELICLDLASGRRRWSADLAPYKGRKKQLLFASGGIAVFVWERNWQQGANGIAAYSLRDGKRLWSTEYASSRATWADTVWFVGGLVWRREGKNSLAGMDPRSGEVTRRITMKGGYCGGCVRNIVTERYLVSTRPPNFISWDNGEVYPFRAGRHGCRAGVIVANGMFYSQPHGCKCVRESLRGFLAFAPADSRSADGTPRLEKGPASDAKLTRPAATGANGWPTFRHDSRRTGAAPGGVREDLKLLWKARLDEPSVTPPRLAEQWRAHPLGVDRATAPCVADGTVCVGLRDAHRLVALDATAGKVRWSYTVGGRLDTPPTLHRGLCLSGCYDGWVYCLRAADGKLVWRLRAAPEDRRIVAHGQLESLWPVVGGVLIRNGVAYFVAGRSAASDGGIHACAVDPLTGEVHWRRTLPAAVSDLLVSEGGALRMAGGGSGGFRFDPATGRPLRSIASSGFRWSYSGKIKTLWGGPNRVLDRAWHVLSVNDTASHWMRIKQGYGPHEGQLLVASSDLKRVFGFRFKYVHWSKVKDRRTELGGEIVAWGSGKEPVWKVEVPKTFQPEALVLAGDVLFAAGPTDRFRRTPGGRLWAISAADGKLLREYPLDAPPAADGIAAADGKLYITTRDAQLLCYGEN